MAEISAKDIFSAARYGELDVLEKAVQLGATEKLAAPDAASGNTPLHMAAANGLEDIIAFLVQHLSAEALSAANAEGNTPMHWAALNGHMAIVQQLLAAGANPAAANARGRTPLDEAQSRGHEDVAIALLGALDIDEDVSEEVSDEAEDLGEDPPVDRAGR